MYSLPVLRRVRKFSAMVYLYDTESYIVKGIKTKHRWKKRKKIGEANTAH